MGFWEGLQPLNWKRQQRDPKRHILAWMNEWIYLIEKPQDKKGHKTTYTCPQIRVGITVDSRYRISVDHKNRYTEREPKNK